MNQLHPQQRLCSLQTVTAGKACASTRAQAFAADTSAQTRRQTTRDRI